MVYETLPEGKIKNALGIHLKIKTVGDSVADILDANNEANVLPDNELEAYTRDTHNLHYYTSKGESYVVTSPNTEIYGSDENYRKLCENGFKAYKQVAEDWFSISTNQPWESVPDDEKELLISYVSQWDRQIGWYEKGNHGIKGGFGFVS